MIAVMVRRFVLACAAAAALAVLPALAAEAGGPAWTSLTPAQQQVLAPLQRDWAGIEPNRKLKWVEVANRFPKMSADERTRLQQRMASWARLTPTERVQARLQFQEVRQLPAEERQARWQEYQSLTADERQQLAQRARPPAKAASDAGAPKRKQPAPDVTNAKRNLVVPAAAPPMRAVAPTVVQAKPGATTTTLSTKPLPPSHNQAGLPKIAATPGYVDPNTLLPQRGPQGAAVRSSAPASEVAAGHP